MLGPFVALLEVHKRMYFMQEAGEPLRLIYVKHHYSPYAENLRHVLRAVEGHLIAGYAGGGDAPDKPLSPAPGAVEKKASLTKRPEEVDQDEWIKDIEMLGERLDEYINAQ